MNCPFKFTASSASIVPVVDGYEIKITVKKQTDGTVMVTYGANGTFLKQALVKVIPGATFETCEVSYRFRLEDGVIDIVTPGGDPD